MNPGNISEHWWSKDWEEFKETLPHQEDPYSKRNWGNGLHSLCSFPGKLKPAIAHHLVDIFVPEGGTVLDPFAGVGTIPFEASLQGYTPYAFDLSPHAFVITKAKLQVTSATKTDDVIRDLEDYLENNIPSESAYDTVSEFGLNGDIEEYYQEDTLQEVLLAREYFLSKPLAELSPSELLVMASLLHVLHGNRPYALSRRSHPITPYAPSGDFEYRPLIPRVEDKVDRSLNCDIPFNFTEGDAFQADSLKWWPVEVDDLDAVITSPPFFDSTRFYSQNWLRLWFAGWEPEDFDNKPSEFVDKRQKETFEVYEPLIRQSRERLKEDGVLVFHLGKSDKCDMADEIRKVAEPWFNRHDILDESVAHVEKHGVEDKGSTTNHMYLVLY